MRAAEFIVISRCLLYKIGPYKLTYKAHDFHSQLKSIPYFLGISFKLSKPPYATGKSLRKLTKIEMAFYQKRKASFSSSPLSKFKSLIKNWKNRRVLQKREGFLSQGIMLKRAGLMSRNVAIQVKPLQNEGQKLLPANLNPRMFFLCAIESCKSKL